MMRGIIAFLLLCSAFSSRAALVTYDLREMTFSDGSRASGYLVWDSRADTYEMPEAFALELNYGTDSVYFSLDSIFSFGFSTTDLVLGNANEEGFELNDTSSQGAEFISFYTGLGALGAEDTCFQRNDDMICSNSLFSLSVRHNDISTSVSEPEAFWLFFLPLGMLAYRMRHYSQF